MALKILSIIFICVLALPSAFGQSNAPEEDIRGPRALIETPAPPPAPDYTPWWIAAASVLVALIALLIILRWKKTHRPLSPEVIANQSLQKLQADDATRTDESFANDVSSILRRYIQARFSIAATQRSSEEFLNEISSTSTLTNHQQSLQLFLRSCDQAKFANSPLHTDVRRDLIEQARIFVTETTTPAS